MNWDALGAVAESLGALGVIVSLIYLAIQVRSNTSAIRAQTAQAVANRAGEITQNFAMDSETMALYFKGLRDPDALTEEERGRFGGILLTLFRTYENVEYQARRGFLETSQWEGQSGNVRAIVAMPGFRVWWEKRGRRGFSAEFVRYVEGLFTSR